MSAGAEPVGHVRLGYARASTARQSLDAQLDSLTEAGVTRVFSEKISTRATRRPKATSPPGGVGARHDAVRGSGTLTLVVLIVTSNLVALGILVNELLNAEVADGHSLLVAALQVWLTNVIAFGLAYWELDRGGPVSRTQLPRDQLPLADFRFSQDENDDAVGEVADGASGSSDWVPCLPDYLYISVTNSTAFSPTDTMPLSTRA
ncbi:recombinase family protein [Streptomyces sp. LN699]|uniref:recombinase family protein n=1 Tax=Streptomyces sp. LN699 TaxID=3112981 RepID=UPI00371F330A